MNTIQEQTEQVLQELLLESKKDGFKIVKGLSKGLFRSIQPEDFEQAYIAISEEQGIALRELILENEIQTIIEFGTSFGISTLFMAQAARQTGGHIITTEILESKAKKAQANFDRAGVADLIELRTGDALKTLKGLDHNIDLLVLDGWSDLYRPLFDLLAPHFHPNTLIYADNANMGGTRSFIRHLAKTGHYQIDKSFNGRVALIRPKSTV